MASYGICVNEACDLSHDSRAGKRLQEHISVLEAREKEGTQSDELLEQINQAAPKIYQDAPLCRNCGKPLVAVPGPSCPVQVNILLAKIKFLENHGVLSRLGGEKAPDLQPVSLAEAMPASRPDRERRVHKRSPTSLAILVRNQKNEEEITKTQNVSRSGVAVALAMTLAVGDTVDVICPYSPGGQNIPKRAEVRWRSFTRFDEMWTYGLEYVRLRG